MTRFMDNRIVNPQMEEKTLRNVYFLLHLISIQNNRLISLHVLSKS